MTKMSRRDLIQFTPDITDCPYSGKIFEKAASMKRGAADEPSLQYFYDAKQMEQMSKSNKTK